MSIQLNFPHMDSSFKNIWQMISNQDEPEFNFEFCGQGGKLLLT